MAPPPPPPPPSGLPRAAPPPPMALPGKSAPAGGVDAGATQISKPTALPAPSTNASPAPAPPPPPMGLPGSAKAGGLAPKSAPPPPGGLPGPAALPPPVSLPGGGSSAGAARTLPAPAGSSLPSKPSAPPPPSLGALPSALSGRAGPSESGFSAPPPPTGFPGAPPPAASTGKVGSGGAGGAAPPAPAPPVPGVPPAPGSLPGRTAAPPPPTRPTGIPGVASGVPPAPARPTPPGAAATGIATKSAPGTGAAESDPEPAPKTAGNAPLIGAAKVLEADDDDDETGVGTIDDNWRQYLGEDSGEDDSEPEEPQRGQDDDSGEDSDEGDNVRSRCDVDRHKNDMHMLMRQQALSKGAPVRKVVAEDTVEHQVAKATVSKPAPAATKRSDQIKEYYVDNRKVNETVVSSTTGLSFRRTKNLPDKDITLPTAKWGSFVKGIDEGDGWLRVHLHFLPFLLMGEAVLIPKEDAPTFSAPQRRTQLLEEDDEGDSGDEKQDAVDSPTHQSSGTPSGDNKKSLLGRWFGGSSTKQGKLDSEVACVASMLKEPTTKYDEPWYDRQLQRLQKDGVSCTKIATNGKPYQRRIHVDPRNLTVEIHGGRMGAGRPTGVMLDDLVDIRKGLASPELEQFYTKIVGKAGKKEGSDVVQRALVLQTPHRTFSFLLPSEAHRGSLALSILYLLKSKNRGVMANVEPGSGSPSERCPKNGHGKVTYQNRSTYEGQFANYMRHGTGTLTLPDGNRYDAQWQFDERQGEGKEFCPDGTTFVGGYLKGMRHGAGVMTWPEGSKYLGQFARGRANGEGELLRTDGSVYKGQFSEDCMSGEGRMQWRDGVEYSGQFMSNRREGHGKMQWSSGRWKSYQGQWKDGVQHGEGVLMNHGDEAFRGIFRAGKLDRWETSP
eukprot:TRINITY_DN43514_c0_g1_i1.p1 TRINITY_DN43514_c0_g1~~TRINITY_DN43514_c0_g1_i1.p1  ORF type:complete len:893 (+),score=172.44 TRINITY_DN43514_c0_g1_i1:151-2829(+)